MKPLAILVAIVVVLAAGWFFVSPLFIDETVDESLDFVLDGGRIDMEAVMSMPETQRQSMKQSIMDAAADAPDTTAAEAMPDAVPTVVAEGRFVDADVIHKGSGRALLYRLPDDSHVVRFEDFRTTNGPALVVYLARHPSPSSAADVTDGGFVKLGDLKGNVGNQNYRVPDATDISEYNSVVIWCELFGVLFSPAALMRIETLAGAGAADVPGKTTPGERDGQVYRLSDSNFLAWDAERERWLEPEAFWRSFAARSEGRQWPAGSEYPPFADVGEHDTFLVQTDKGPCLMHFFHGRWRRANDVWRWDDAFNRYGACPYVFD